jgi:2-polyprenyl-6-methoxyphenol hydroxylase-like FAD-dependent oxidoreductase
MTETLGQRAIVVGASIAGLMTARVLSEFFDEVVAIDRDDIEDRPIVHKSVPQGHHLHAFLQGGLNVVSSLYPLITDELRRLGATRIAMGRDAVWYTPNGKAYNFTGSVRSPFDSGLEGYCASRGLLEFVIRRRTAAIPNIHFEYGTAVTELISRDATVVGVRCGKSRSIEADLVVDATGRAHRARQWLAAIGFSPPDETDEGPTPWRKWMGQEEFFCFLRKAVRRNQVIHVIAPAEHKRVVGATKPRYRLHQQIENPFKVDR